MKEKIEKSNTEEILELNMVQSGMLFHYLKEAGENRYNVQLAFDINGTLDIPLMQDAFQRVQSQNEVLRSVFRWEGISKPVQIILKDYPFNFVYHDLCQQSPEYVSDFVQYFLLKDQNDRFDLRRLP